MEEYKRCQIPAFGNWDYSDDLPITQYFESARQAGLLRYNDFGDDFYGEHLKKPVAPPATVYISKEKEGSNRYQHVKEPKKQGRVCDVTEPPVLPHKAPKAVDEDLYQIPPQLLHRKHRSNKFTGFLSRFLVCYSS